MTKILPRAASAACAAVLLSASAQAQTVQGVLVGQKSLAPIASAQLALVDDSGHVTPPTTSDSGSGAFYLDAPKAGRYKLRILVGRGGLSYSPAFQVDSGQTIERKFAVPEWPTAVLEAYLPDDVSKKAAYKPGNRAPRFPDALRAAGRDGLARVLFVVKPDGRPDMSTFSVVESDDDAFTRATRDAAEEAQFIPAERDGVAVPEVFEMVVDYGFGTEPGRASGENVIVVRALGIVRQKRP
jgi:TonB family protein